MELPIAAAWCALGKLTTDEAIDAAHAALNRGVYSEALGAVTYAEPLWSEVGPLFRAGAGRVEHRGARPGGRGPAAGP